MLIEVANGFGNCGFFQRENWKQILDANFNANLYAENMLQFIEEAIASKNNDLSKVKYLFRCRMFLLLF